MTAAAFTAGAFLAVYAHYAPKWYADDPQRIATIAVASEQVQTAMLPKWSKGIRLLGATIATVVTKESGLWPSVHSGERRGRAGEVCLVQIHPVNTQWQGIAPSFDELAGTSLQNTTWCLQTGVTSLTSGLSRCLRKHYLTNWAQAMWTSYHWSGSCWLSPHAYERTERMNTIAAKHWEPTEEQLVLVANVVAL